ncbi:hypothetical protein C4571_03075, partial [Candidatus Parcubacteria bacterium]
MESFASFFFWIPEAGAAVKNIFPVTANSVASDTPAGIIVNFYQFALMIGGVLAFGAIVYGGIKYVV